MLTWLKITFELIVGLLAIGGFMVIFTGVNTAPEMIYGLLVVSVIFIFLFLFRIVFRKRR
ncbi:MAG: hypothetical protein AAB768_03905 [Patescibacteria group bacterium]